MHCRTLNLVALSFGLAITATACSDDATTASERPVVEFTADDTTLTGPTEVPSGFVDVRIKSTGTIGHHLFFARLNDDVTFDEAMTAPDEEFFSNVTLHGGNGSVAAGTEVSMSLELKPGNYFALDNPQNDNPTTAQFTVSKSGSGGREPQAKGTVKLGPNMALTVPNGFDAKGVWEFVNDDPQETHEAALVKLAPGKTVADIVEWAKAFEGPPPFDGEYGAMGALGPKQRAWITLQPGDPGDYALICLIPGEEGKPHLLKGMARAVSVRN